MDIQIWNNLKFQEHIDLKNYPTWQNNNGRRYFWGFKYVGPKFIEQRPAFDKGECTFQIPNVETFSKDRHIVALQDSDLVGIFSLMYGFYHYSFPHYYPRILEIRKDKQNQGIATALVRRLKEPCFLHGQVLMIRDGSYTAEGFKHLKKVFERELTRNHFKLVDGTMTRLESYV